MTRCEQDILRGAADEVLAILKDDTLTDPKRHVEVEKLIRRLSNEKFNKLVTLGKQIHDFRVGGAEEGEEVDEEQQLDEEMGVAVVFDEDDEEEEESDIDEVQEEEEEVRRRQHVYLRLQPMIVLAERLCPCLCVIVMLQEEDDLGEDTGQESRLKAQRGEDEMEVEEEDDKLKLSVHDIDAFWLQRQLSKYYEDANISAKLADDVLQLLAVKDELDCESKLVVLLDVDKFDLIKQLVRNRSKVGLNSRLA